MAFIFGRYKILFTFIFLTDIGTYFGKHAAKNLPQKYDQFCWFDVFCCYSDCTIKKENKIIKTSKRNYENKTNGPIYGANVNTSECPKELDNREL